MLSNESAVRGDSLWAMRLMTMAMASNGVPSWNWTPSRGVRVHWVKSSFASKDSSRYGLTSSSTSYMVCGSMTDRITMWQEMAHEVYWGVHGLAESASRP
jgi:hypothetical protein